MKKHIQLLDHNIERANGLTVESGRFRGTVSLAIGGTIGRMTVSAFDLLKAVSEVMASWSKQPKESNHEYEIQDASIARKTRTKVSDSKENRQAIRHKQSPISPNRAETSVSVQSLAYTRNSLKTINQPSSSGWTPYQDKVISITSPEIAAKKLKKPVAEINSRRRQLGL